MKKLLLAAFLFSCNPQTETESVPKPSMKQKHGFAEFNDGKMGLFHDIYPQLDGTLVVACSVVDANTETSAYFQWRSDQPGFNASYCSVLHDVENDGTFGFFSFTEGSATYLDPMSILDGESVILDYKVY
jgi:hypothetical protein